MIYTLDQENDNSAELRVAKAIEARQPSWHIIHSRWFAHLAPSRTAEREGDIVVIVPERGFFVIEVKGASEFRIDHGRWFRKVPRTDRWEAYDKPPWQQAAKVMHYFKDRLRKVMGTQIGAYGFAVAFPNSRIPLQFAADPRLDGTEIRREDYLSLTIDSTMLETIDFHIEELLRSQAGRGDRRCDTAALLKEFLPSGTPLAPDHGVAADLARERFAQLTQHQLNAVNGALENPRVMVRGGPGSGKSVIARHIARQVSASGGRCMLLCFNRLLRDDTELSLQGTGVEVRTIHELGAALVARNAQVLGTRGRAAFATEQEWLDYCSSDGLLVAATSGLVGRVGTLIVDEYQDLLEPQADAVRSIPADRVILLGDPNQNLFGDAGAGLAVPQGFVAYRLPENIRNCHEVAKCVRAMCPKDARHEDFTASPVMHRWPTSLPFRDPKVFDRLLASVVGEWKSWGFKKSRIAFLCATRAAAETCARTLQRLGHQCTDDLRRWKSDQACFVGTIRSFKGLDADGVLLVDPPPLGDPALCDADAYVATSRASLDFRILHRDVIDVSWLSNAVEAAANDGR